jgi:hypothetical protein
MLYDIEIKGYFKHGHFESWTVLKQVNHNTTLRGECQDQAALYGILRRIQDLGMVLIAVNPVRSSTDIGGK